jgi:hypothetical protein
MNQAPPGSAGRQPGANGIQHELGIVRLLSRHPGEVHSAEKLSRAGSPTGCSEDPVIPGAVPGLVGWLGKIAGSFTLTDARKLTLEPASTARAPPEEIKSRIVHRSILSSSNEDRAACHPDPIPRIEPDEVERAKECGGLAGVHIEPCPPQYPAELHDVGRQMFAGIPIPGARKTVWKPRLDGHATVGSNFAAD